jgi:hypothetical protein
MGMGGQEYQMVRAKKIPIPPEPGNNERMMLTGSLPGKATQYRMVAAKIDAKPKKRQTGANLDSKNAMPNIKTSVGRIWDQVAAVSGLPATESPTCDDALA